MNAYEAVRTVLAVRSYQDKPIPVEAIHRIVEAAHLTGSSMNRQPWHFIVVDDRAMLRKLGATAKSGAYIAEAALAVVVAIEEDSPFAVSDASRAIQSMMLTAWDEGIGSNWVGFHGLEAVNPLLSIPDGLDVLAIIPFGYPTETLGKGQKERKPFAEVIHYGHFGQPLT